MREKGRNYKLWLKLIPLLQPNHSIPSIRLEPLGNTNIIFLNMVVFNATEQCTFNDIQEF